MVGYQPLSFLIYKKWLPVSLLLAARLITNAQDSSLTVIGNVSGVPSALKYAELVSVMKGERQRWSDGTKVSIYLMKTTTPIGESTCKKVYNMSGDRVKRYWLELSFSGKGDIFICNSVEQLEWGISQNPGAIGVLDRRSDVTGIKVVLIDGKNSF